MRHLCIQVTNSDLEQAISQIQETLELTTNTNNQIEKGSGYVKDTVSQLYTYKLR